LVILVATNSVNYSGALRKEDNARAMLDRITHIASDLESAKVKAKSLFETLNMPQNPDGLRILDQNGQEVFFWTPRTEDVREAWGYVGNSCVKCASRFMSPINCPSTTTDSKSLFY
jgi:hypothetical protein